jgi:hypothetical protein
MPSKRFVLPVFGKPGLVEPALDLGLRRAVEDGRGEVETERVRRPAEVRLENLADVHTRRNAERIQHDLHRRAVRQMRHVFLGKDARDDALVAVAAGHLVADRQLALHRHVHLDELDDARRQLVAAANLLFFSSKSWRMTSTWRSVLSSSARRSSSSRGSSA